MTDNNSNTGFWARQIQSRKEFKDLVEEAMLYISDNTADLGIVRGEINRIHTSVYKLGFIEGRGERGTRGRSINNGTCHCKETEDNDDGGRGGVGGVNGNNNKNKKTRVRRGC